MTSLRSMSWNLALCSVLLACVGCRSENSPGARKQSGNSERDRIVEMLDLHNRGIGHLENKEWGEAEDDLSKLHTLLPQNVDVAQNLAISRTLSLIDRSSPFSQSKDPKAFNEMLARARAAITTFRELSTSSVQQSIAALLAGKLAAFEDSPANRRIDDALDMFRQAITLSGDRPEMWYAFAVAMEGHRDFSDSPELIRTLQKIAELAPENLAVIGKLLEKQALGLNSKNAETKALAEGISSTLEKASLLLAPLNTAIKQQRRVDLVETIRKALDGPGKADVNTLLGPAMMTKNLLLPELATQLDLRRIDLNLLEYLVIDIGSTLPISPEIRADVFPPTEPSVLQPFTAGTGLPEVSGVTNVQMCDVNLDGIDDLILVQDGRIRVYSTGLDSTTPWTLLMESPDDSGPFSHCLLIDIDRDFDRALSDVRAPSVLRDQDGDQKIVKDPVGQRRWFDTDPDLIAWNASGVVILRNTVAADGSRSLTVLPQATTVEDIQNVAAADLESDGDLDLIFATTKGLVLWKNIDGATFEPITEGVSLPDFPISALAIGDWNRDMAMDVVAVSTDGKAGWLQNMLHGRFRWNGGVSISEGLMDVALDEMNGDGHWDLIAAGPQGVFAVLPKNNDKIADAEVIRISGKGGTAIHRADLDNDGRSDFLVSSPDGLILLRGLGNGSADDLTSLLPESGAMQSVTTSDIDDDGDLDIVAVDADGRLQLLVNNGGNQNQWIDVVARAVGDDAQFPSNRVNMHGRGSVIEVRAGAAYQAHVIDSPKLHLGLGKAQSVDTIRIIWTDGIPNNITSTKLLRARLGILAPQILTGSCPYIYTWNGERFEFFSDCLWAAPLGLVQATGDMAPTREWEYLLISGDQLKARDGRYVIQLTEELWEAAYFDEVKLMAVDHPTDVAIFTNEKVGSPAMAAHRIHTVKSARLPISAVDGLGRDLLPGLKAQDKDYVQPFKGRILQGLTDEWTMEFDLGQLGEPNRPAPKDIRLVLIGWVFPTNTSLNQAILQNPNLDAPAPPSLEVIDAEGNWKTVRPFIGFPSGKTKAMVVDLSNAFLTTDYRVRIRSSMELYWDHAFFTVDEADAETRSHECSLVAADLHYRGFSRRTYADNALFRNGHAPEGYDYDQVTTEPRWNEMLGRFTCYGQPTDLLKNQDDQIVVMGPGDEMTVEFAVPADDPPTGWKRDFVLYNVGWDKDADLSTVYGQSSEPYPFAAMTRYPEAPDGSEPSSPEYQRYLDTWQTREYPRFRFRDVVRNAGQSLELLPDVVLRKTSLSK
jgi:hypothetical protein